MPVSLYMSQKKRQSNYDKWWDMSMLQIQDGQNSYELNWSQDPCDMKKNSKVLMCYLKQVSLKALKGISTYYSCKV